MRRQIEVFLWILIQKWPKFQKQINLEMNSGDASAIHFFLFYEIKLKNIHFFPKTAPLRIFFRRMEFVWKTENEFQLLKRKLKKRWRKEDSNCGEKKRFLTFLSILCQLGGNHTLAWALPTSQRRHNGLCRLFPPFRPLSTTVGGGTAGTSSNKIGKNNISIFWDKGIDDRSDKSFSSSLWQKD